MATSSIASATAGAGASARGNVGYAATIDIKTKMLNSLNMKIWSLCTQIYVKKKDAYKTGD